MEQQQKNDVSLTTRYPQALIDRIDEHRRKRPDLPSRQQVLREMTADYLRRKAEGA